MGTTALPLSDLDDAIVTIHRTHHSANLVDGIGHGFFHIDVLARRAGIDHLQAMPVIGRTDNNGVHIRIVEQGPIVTIESWRGAGCGDDVGGTFRQNPCINVTQGHTTGTGNFQHRTEVGKTHPFATDNTYVDRVARCRP